MAALSAVFALVLLCFAVPPATTAKPKAPAGMYWGAWIGDQITGTQAPFDMEAVSRFEGAVGKGLSLIEFSSPYANCATSPCRYYRFPSREMQKIREYGAIPFFGWGAQTTPWDAAGPTGDNPPNIRLADVAGGAYDEYVRQFAQEAAAWGHPFFLRFNWEMNGDWFPWGRTVSGNRPRHFVAAWRHVHDAFAAAGATNVTWVWCPYADKRKKYLNLKAFYPGGKYVDWTCLDGYNWGRVEANPHPWRSFDQIFAASYRKLTTKVAPKKPLILGEIASSSKGGNKARWITDMMRALPRRYPKVRGLIWFETIDRGIDWPLANAPRPLGAFAKGVRRANWASNAFSALGAGPILPPP